MTMSLSAAAVLYSSGSVISARAELVTRGLDEREDLRPDADKAVAREREMAGESPSDTPEEARRAEPREALPPAGGREDYASHAEMSAGRARIAIEALHSRDHGLDAVLERLDHDADLPENAIKEVPEIPGFEEERESPPAPRTEEPPIAVDTGPDSVRRGEELSEPLDLRI